MMFIKIVGKDRASYLRGKLLHFHSQAEILIFDVVITVERSAS